MPKVHLFRWWKRTQIDISWRPGGFKRWLRLHSPAAHSRDACYCQKQTGWLSIGLDRRRGWRPIAYWSPDATTTHELARGWKAER